MGYKTNIRKKLNKLKLDKTVVNYFVEAVDYCIKEGIAPVDVVLTKHFYPNLEKKYNTTKAIILKNCILSIKESWNTVEQKVFIAQLGYGNKPTVKKLLVLLLNELKEKGIE